MEADHVTKEIRPYRPGDIEAIVARVRRADAEELWAMYRSTPREAIEIGLANSDAVMTGVVGTDPICIFGSAPASSLLASYGVPWMVGTDLLDKYAIIFLRRCRPVVQTMLDHYGELRNYVDARNTRAILWLRSLGFTIHPARPMGVYGMPFHLFTMTREV